MDVRVTTTPSFDSLNYSGSKHVYKYIICKLEPDEGQPLSVHGTSLCQLISGFSFTWKLTTILRQLYDHHSITKAAGRLFLSIVISKQLNAARYLRHKPWQLREDIVPAWPAVLNSRFHVCTSLAPRPMNVVFGLGTKLHVRMRTTLENGVLRNRQN